MVYLAGQILVFVLAAMLVGAALAWFFLIGPLRRDAVARKAVVGDSDSTAATDPVAGADSAVSEAAVADLTVRLRRQEDEWALERADLTARLATAEQQAGESERRVAAAEYQVSEAERRVGDIERQLRDVAVSDPTEDGDPGGSSVDQYPSGSGTPRPATTVAGLAQETKRLREALADAEGRTAKFSSRLAMVRTEAEDAQRQVATMVTRLDRHQAEWAAEKVRLLARLDDVEQHPAHGRRKSAQAQNRSAAGVDESHRDHVPVAESADADGGSADGVDVVGDEDESMRPTAAGSSSASTSSVAPTSAAPGPTPKPTPTPTPTPKPTSSYPPAGCRSRRFRQRPRRPPRRPRGPQRWTPSFFPLGRDGRYPGSDVLAGFVTTLRAGTIAANRPDPVGVVPSARDSGSRRELARQDLARRSTDNLKDVVGIGPLVETRLHNLGITSFRQLAVMGDADVHRLVSKLEGLGDRIVSDDWVGQARDLQAKRYGGFS